MSKRFIGKELITVLLTLSNGIVNKCDKIDRISQDDVTNYWDDIKKNDVSKHLFYRTNVPTGNMDISELPDYFKQEYERRYMLNVKIFKIGQNDWWCQTHEGGNVEDLNISFNGPMCIDSYNNKWIDDQGWTKDCVITRYNSDFPEGKTEISKEPIIYLDGISSYNIYFLMNLHKIFRLTDNDEFDPLYYYLFTFSDRLGGTAYNDSSKHIEVELGAKYFLSKYGQFDEKKISHKECADGKIIMVYPGISFASCYNH